MEKQARGAPDPHVGFRAAGDRGERGDARAGRWRALRRPPAVPVRHAGRSRRVDVGAARTPERRDVAETRRSAEGGPALAVPMIENAQAGGPHVVGAGAPEGGEPESRARADLDPLAVDAHDHRLSGGVPARRPDLAVGPGPKRPKIAVLPN